MAYHARMAFTIADIQDDVDTYADYDIVGSVSRAGLYVVACRRLLGKMASTASDQGSSVSMDTARIAENMKRAQSYIAANSGSSVRFLGPGRGFR